MHNFKAAYKAIAFDFGGVLVDWNPRYLYLKRFQGDAHAVERFLEEIGFFAWNLEMDRGCSFQAGITELCARFPRHADLIRAYDRDWQESIVGPIESTVQILRSLKERGYALYGLSNWAAEKFQLIRSRYTFFDWFDAIIISGEVNLIKPDPRIYALLLQKARCRAEECLFIDDSETNVRAAAQLGFGTIQYRSSEQLQAELRLLGIAC